MYIKIILLLLLASSCGYRLSEKNAEHSTRTIAVPYAYGDGDGLLTAEIIAQVQKESGFSYMQDGAEFTLKVTLLDTKSENIGWRYDPHKLKNGKKKLI